LQRALIENPEMGDLMPGTGGFRKVRWEKVMKQKRKLFDELMAGVATMQQREGKITLRSHEVEDLPPLEVDAELIRDTRERMHVSRAVFARRLRVSTRTLENWEQGRARPNAQAAALILMVRKFPDTLEKLSELGPRAA
jgi:putative transcriptional regulator